MDQSFEIVIAETELQDLPAINSILNEAIANTNAYLSNKQKTMEEMMDWYSRHHTTDSHFALTAKHRGVVVGWASLSPFRQIEGFALTAEVSVYTHVGFRGKGIGDCLLKSLIETASKRNFHSLVSVITSDNEVSISLHQKNGFELQGMLKESATKNGKLFDVVFMAKLLA